MKMKFYRDEKRLRHQLERLYNCQTGLDLGPASPPDVDVRQWLARYLQGQGSTMVLAQLPTAMPVSPMPAPVIPDQSQGMAEGKPALPAAPVLPERRAEPRLVFTSQAATSPVPGSTELPQPVVVESIRVETATVPVIDPVARQKKPAQVATSREYYQFAGRVLNDVDQVLAGMFRATDGALAKNAGTSAEGDAEFTP